MQKSARLGMEAEFWVSSYGPNLGCTRPRKVGVNLDLVDTNVHFSVGSEDDAPLVPAVTRDARVAIKAIHVDLAADLVRYLMGLACCIHLNDLAGLMLGTTSARRSGPELGPLRCVVRAPPKATVRRCWVWAMYTESGEPEGALSGRIAAKASSAADCSGTSGSLKEVVANLNALPARQESPELELHGGPHLLQKGPPLRGQGPIGISLLERDAATAGSSDSPK